ncbi:MAG TPA: hypothetical protein VGO58_05740 [Chitinophagaceae bacterium]|jgi:hypothetical protein|nr:hypothetical protein [Chitinophagaceae bacterium]
MPAFPIQAGKLRMEEKYRNTFDGKIDEHGLKFCKHYSVFILSIGVIRVPVF